MTYSQDSTKFINFSRDGGYDKDYRPFLDKLGCKTQPVPSKHLPSKVTGYAIVSSYLFIYLIFGVTHKALNLNNSNWLIYTPIICFNPGRALYAYSGFLNG